jgi:hypothetical protein
LRDLLIDGRLGLFESLRPLVERQFTLGLIVDRERVWLKRSLAKTVEAAKGRTVDVLKVMASDAMVKGIGAH